MKKILAPGLLVYGVIAGLGLFHGPGLSSPLLIPWLAGYLFLVLALSYSSLFVKDHPASFEFLVLGIIGLNFIIQVTGGPASPFRYGYFLLAAAATFQPLVRAYAVPVIIVAVEALNLLLGGGPPPGGWMAFAGFGVSLCGVAGITMPFTSRIKNQAKHARERYRKLLSDASAVDPLAGGMKLDAITDRNRQAANVSVATEREGAFKGLFDIIAGIVPAHTYALFVDDQGDGVFTLRGIRSRSRQSVAGNVRIERGSGLIGISANTNQPQYLPHMVIPVKSLGYYSENVPVKSFLALPIRQEDHIVGVLAVDSLESEAFPPDTQDLLGRFVPFFSQIIETIRASIEMDMRAKNFAALHEMSEVLNSSLELEVILDKVTGQIRSVADYDVCAFTLYDDKTGEVVLNALRGYDASFINARFPLDRSAIISHMFRQWRDQGSAGIYYDPRLGTRGKEIGLFPIKELQKPLQSLYGRPLVAREKFIGAFFLGSQRPDAFTEYQRYFIDTLMNQVSMVIDNTMLHRNIRDMARTDGLTGLLNHRTFMEKLGEEYKRLDREPRPFSILLLDIDNFKKVNDTYGHPVGDIALARVARVLKETVRSVDFVARYGGEEFAVGMVDTDGKGARQMAERVRKLVEKMTITAPGNIELRVTLSIGISSLPEDGKRMDNLLTMADDALYHAKRSGRNRVCQHREIPASAAAPAKSPR